MIGQTFPLIPASKTFFPELLFSTALIQVLFIKIEISKIGTVIKMLIYDIFFYCKRTLYIIDKENKCPLKITLHINCFKKKDIYNRFLTGSSVQG